jgi:hypothetical protein
VGLCSANNRLSQFIKAMDKSRPSAHGFIGYTADQVLEVRVEEEYGLQAYLEILDHESRLIDEQARLAHLPQTAYQRASLERLTPLAKTADIEIPRVGSIEWALRYRNHCALADRSGCEFLRPLRQRLRSKLSSASSLWQSLRSSLSLIAEQRLRQLLGRHYPGGYEYLLLLDGVSLSASLGEEGTKFPAAHCLTTGVPPPGLRTPMFSHYFVTLAGNSRVAVLVDEAMLPLRPAISDAVFKLGVSEVAVVDKSNQIKGLVGVGNMKEAQQAPSGVTVNEWPRISIVTVSYNQAAFLSECIDSVLGQGYPHLEYIVIDGESTDGSRTILERYKEKLSTLIVEPDRGQSHALNKGFARASGDVMTWLCSDDRLEPGAMSVVAEAILKHRPDLVVGGCRVIDETGKTKAVHRSAFVTHKKSPLSFGDLCSFSATWQKAYYFYQPEVFFTHDLWTRSGSHIKEHLHYAMDYELFLRFALAGAEVFASRQILGCSRQHGEQKTRHDAPMYLPTAARILRDFRQDLAAMCATT